MNYTIAVDEPFGGEFKEEMFPVELVAGHLVQVDIGQRSLMESDYDSLFLQVVRHVIKFNPARVYQAVEDRQFAWLSRRSVDGPSHWLAANRLMVGLPMNCREEIVRIYNLCNVCGVLITDLKFKCEVPPNAMDASGESTEVPQVVETISSPQEDNRAAVEVLAEQTREKVQELGREMLDVYAFFVISAFEKRLAPMLDECLRAGYTRSAIETILSAGIEGLVFSGEGEQRTVRFGSWPRSFGEDALATRIREQLSGEKSWVPLSELVADIPEITEAWAVPFIEDVIPDAIPSVENGSFGYRLLGRFRFPPRFESCISQCDFTSWSETIGFLREYYGAYFLEEYHLTADILKEVLGYYAQLWDIPCPTEWQKRIRPSAAAHPRRALLHPRTVRSAVPIDFALIPLAADPNRDVLAVAGRQPYGLQPDASQSAFIESPARFIRLLAPAGSGKTTTMLFRCRKLLAENPHGRILLLTFTRVAAEELRQRMRRYAEFLPLCGHVDVTTLNAYGYRIVRHAFPHSRLVETSSNWKVFALQKYLKGVLESSDNLNRYSDDLPWMREHSPSLMKFFDTLKTLAIDHEEVKGEEALLNRLAMLAKSGHGPSMLFEESVNGLKEADWLRSSIYSRQLSEVAQNLLPLYEQASEVMKDQGALTFEDQKYWAWKIVKMPGMRMERNGYAHVMVDEFQDVNPIDLELVKSLQAINQASLTIVGDDDQTIFEWRGATPKYIVNPENFFSPRQGTLAFTSYLLSINYRSPQNIVEHAQQLIRHNRKRVAKKTGATNHEIATVVCLQHENYDAILKKVLLDVDNPAYQSVAVITRKRSHLIPYQILLASQERVFFAAEDLNVLLSDAFARIIKILEIHEYENFRIDHAIELLTGVRTYRLGKEKEEIVRNVFADQAYPTLNAFATGLMLGDFEEAFEKRGPVYGRKIQDFLCTRTVSDAVRCLADNFHGFKKDFERGQDSIFFTDPPFEELAEFAERYACDYFGFVSDLKKAIANLGEIISNHAEGGEQRIQNGLTTKLHLMTGLRTKGKEYDVVYILRADNDVWPNPQAFKAGFEEGERRLFYVAITRARKKLCFTFDHPTDYLREAHILMGNNRVRPF